MVYQLRDLCGRFGGLPKSKCPASRCLLRKGRVEGQMKVTRVPLCQTLWWLGRCSWLRRPHQVHFRSWGGGHRPTWRRGPPCPGAWASRTFFWRKLGENQADVERDDLNLKKAVHVFPFKEFQVFLLIPSLCVLPVIRGGRETEFSYGRAED